MYGGPSDVQSKWSEKTKPSEKKYTKVQLHTTHHLLNFQMSTFNVLRYSALGAGVLYGAVHRYNLESAVSEQHKAEEWKKQEKLIKEAKAEYARLHAPKDKPSSGAGLSLKTLEDPNVDFGKVLESLVQKLE